MEETKPNQQTTLSSDDVLWIEDYASAAAELFESIAERYRDSVGAGQLTIDLSYLELDGGPLTDTNVVVASVVLKAVDQVLYSVLIPYCNAAHALEQRLIDNEVGAPSRTSPEVRISDADEQVYDLRCAKDNVYLSQDDFLPLDEHEFLRGPEVSVECGPPLRLALHLLSMFSDLDGLAPESGVIAILPIAKRSCDCCGEDEIHCRVVMQLKDAAADEPQMPLLAGIGAHESEIDDMVRCLRFFLDGTNVRLDYPADLGNSEASIMATLAEMMGLNIDQVAGMFGVESADLQKGTLH